MPKRDIEHGHASVEDFFYWINERHRIYEKRAAGEPFPWSDDEILNTYKFTNAFRQLDRGTVWLTENIIAKEKCGCGGFAVDEACCHGPERSANLPNLLFNIVMYRMYNFWEAAEKVGYITDWPTQRERWTTLTGKIFTSAHMTVGESGRAKRDTYTDVFDELWPLRKELCEHLKAAPSLEEAFRRFMKFKVYGCGHFISYEIISDLRWTPILSHANDICSWANIGPGCARGLRRLGMPENVESLRKLYQMSPEYLELHVLKHHPWNELEPELPYFEMREIEHSLCEFDKYQRVKTGAGRPREKFRNGSIPGAC